MSEFSALLPLYRWATAGLQPVVPAVLRWRRRRGMEDLHRMRERMGVAGLPRPEGRLIWLHAASVGDGELLLPLVARLGARGFHVLVSTRTLASANVLERRLPAESFHQFMPIDLASYVGRFLDHWRPDIVLLAGAELWPNVLIEANHRGLPIIFVNARMSDRAYRQCRRLRRFVGSLLARVDLCLTRTDLDAERFVELGATSVQTVGDLAFDTPTLDANPTAVSAFAARVGARPIWIAAAIETSDRALILQAHGDLLRRFPDLVTVIAPRSPGDGAEIAREAEDRNLATALRSRDGLPRQLPNLYVADVAGELGLFYRACGIAFIGHSFGGAGRSPIDAAKLGCAILHGPQVEDFAAIYAALDEAQGGTSVNDATVLVRAVSLLIEDSATLRLMQRNARQTTDRLCGGTARVMRAIEPHMVQMLVER